ncbi:MAG TPA: hypothetical protein VFS34_09135 [Thermoanaerobaculia bacterium]|nr:hypothetical protein [Thermoanaerobaculia bacterium]
MKRLFGILGLAIAVPLFAAEAPEAPLPLLAMPDTNPLACGADAPPGLVTRDFPSGVEVMIPAFVAVRVNASGAIEEVLLVHDPIPSLEAQERQSFQKWEFLPPKKGGTPVAGWATLELNLKVEYSRPQIARATVVPVGPQDAVPAARGERWDESWLTTAPALADLKGAESAEALDQPALPKRTKWYADRYKGPLAVKLWIEIGESGRATRLAPVDVKDAALLPYLEKAISRWTFTPARKEGKAITCWAVLELGGTISYDVSLVRAASIKKSVGP